MILSSIFDNFVYQVSIATLFRSVFAH